MIFYFFSLCSLSLRRKEHINHVSDFLDGFPSQGTRESFLIQGFESELSREDHIFEYSLPSERYALVKTLAQSKCCCVKNDIDIFKLEIDM